MAIFTTQVTGPNGVNNYDYNVADIANYANETFSATQIRFFNDANNEEVFTGSGFTFDPVTGLPLTGTITGYVNRENGVITANVTGLNVSALDLGNAINNNDTFLFLSLLAAGSDTVTGSAFNDQLFFGLNAGADTINGLAGYDDLVGGTGTDTLNGGDDGDYIVGGAGNDILDGGSGGDNYDALGYVDEYLGEGGTQGVTVNLSGVTQGGLLSGRAIDSFGNTDTVSNFEEVVGTGFNDTVYASLVPNSDFTFRGFAGADTFVGTSGRDRIVYFQDERFAANAFERRGLTLTATGITVNFSGDVVAGNGASGTVIDSFGAIDTVSGVDAVKATFFVDTFNGGADDENFMGLKGADIINGGGGFDVSAYRDDEFDNGVQAGGLQGIVANFSGDVTADGISVGTVVDGFGTIDQLTNIEAIAGTDFADTFTGGVDRVEFWARRGADNITGGSADDYLEGGEGSDIIHGGGGHDNIRGDEGGSFDQGDDQMFGDAGDDSFKGGAGSDLIDGGADRDQINYNLETTFTGDDATHGVIVNLTTAALVNVSVAGIPTVTVAAGKAIDTRNFVDTLVSIESVEGTGYDDIIVADVGQNDLVGLQGADILKGGLDNDYVVGGEGADNLDGGTGGDDYDTLGYSDEYFYQGGTQGVSVNLSSVTQGSLLAGRAIDAFGNSDTVANFESVQGTGFADTVYAPTLVNDQFEFKGHAGDDIFVGSGGNDRIDYAFDERFAQQALEGRNQVFTATGITVNFAADAIAGNGASGTVIDSFGNTDTVSGVDSVRATFFVDTFNGGVDDEEFQGLKGADIINGGGGFDVAAYYNDRNDNGVQGGSLSGITVNFAGDTTANGISVGTVVDGFATIDQLTNIEAVDGTDFDDTFTGGADKVEFWSGQGADTFKGGSANDYADGGDGSDSLLGGAGGDHLNGGADADKLLGDGAVMPTETANQIIRLYLATLGRGPDDAGLSHWTTQRDAGQSLDSIATGFVTSTEFTNKYGLNISNAAFVTLLYQNVLDRLPDTAGLNGWVATLDGGASRESVVTGFSESVEFIRVSDTELHVGQTYRLYGATFGRAPDTDGFVGWVGALDDGVGILEAANLFINSPEFELRYGTGLTNSAFVNQLFQNVLGRAPDAPGLAYWLNEISNGMSRANVLLGFSDSVEFINNTRADLNDYMQSVQPNWNDFIAGGSGDDQLAAGRGADVFYFNKTELGADQIYGYEAWDTIDLDGFGYADKAAAISHLASAGANVIFSDQGQSITFHETTLAELQAGNWVV